MVWIVLGFVAVLIICISIIIFLARKVETLQNLLEELDVKYDKSIEFITSINNRFFEDYSNLKKIDQGGSFESDDEVGFVFDSIKETVLSTFMFLNENIKNLDKYDEETEDKE